MRKLTEAVRRQKLADAEKCRTALADAASLLCHVPTMSAVPGAARWDRLFRTLQQLQHAAAVRIEDLGGRGAK